MPRKRPPRKIDIRDRRLSGGRLSISAQTTSAPVARKREAAIRTLLDHGEYAVIDRIRSGDLHISDAARMVAAGRTQELRPTSRGALTIETVAERLLRIVEATKSPGTLAVYQNQIVNIKRCFGADREIPEVLREEVERYLFEPKSTKKGGKAAPWAPTTINSAHMIGSKLFSLALDMETEGSEREGTAPRMTRNVWRAVGLPEILPTRAEFLSPEEWHAVALAAADTPRAAMLALGALAGLRISETRNLRPGVDLDMEARTIKVQARKGAHPWRPKTRRGTRTVPINDSLHKILARHIELGFPGARYLIRLPHRDRPISTATGIRWTRDAFTAAGINYGRKRDSLTNHNLRHTYASWLAQNGVDLLRIAELLGDTMAQVIQTYAHLTDRNLVEANRVIDQVLR